MAVENRTQRTEPDERLSRYSRQMFFEPIGAEGQQKLLDAKVVLFGCGGLGTVLSGILARAGVGFIRIVDRDFIELSNLQRQQLFDEDDLASNLPKAEAARRKLLRINSDIQVEAIIRQVDHKNIESLADGADLLLDGTDNFNARFLINDLAVKTRRPWVYGAAVASRGLSMPIIPNDTPCLRCILESVPPQEMTPSCNVVGVLSPVINMVASHQAMEAIKILMGRYEAVDRKLLKIDVWSGEISRVDVQATYEQGDCVCCRSRQFEYLDGAAVPVKSTVLPERNAVQLFPADDVALDFSLIAAKIKALAGAQIAFNPYMLKAYIDSLELILFPDGRAIVNGTDELERAEALYKRYVGEEPRK